MREKIDALGMGLITEQTHNQELQAEIEALKAEKTHLQKDAQRYRFLREIGGLVCHVGDDPKNLSLAIGTNYDFVVDYKRKETA